MLMSYGQSGMVVCIAIDIEALRAMGEGVLAFCLWLLAVGCWLLAICLWLLAFGCWLKKRDVVDSPDSLEALPNTPE